MFFCCLFENEHNILGTRKINRISGHIRTGWCLKLRVQGLKDKDPAGQMVASRVVEQQGLDAERITAPHADRRGLVDQVGHRRRCCRRRGVAGAPDHAQVSVLVMPKLTLTLTLARDMSAQGRLLLLAILQVQLVERLGGEEQRLGGVVPLPLPLLRLAAVHGLQLAEDHARRMATVGWRHRAGTAQAAAPADEAARPRTVPVAVQAAVQVLLRRGASSSSAATATATDRTHGIAVQLVVAVGAADHVDLDAVVLQVGVGKGAVGLVL